MAIEKILKIEGSSITWTCKQIVKMIDKETISFKNVVQRSFVWERHRMSELIWSIIMGYPIPPIYAERGSADNEKIKVYDVMDGQQRNTSIYKFIKDDGSTATKVYPYNMHGTLMKPYGEHKNKQAVQMITMPDEIVEVRVKPKSKTTMEIYFDQWIISMRLHNADTKIKRTSLKFDVQIKAQPRKVMGTILPWNV